MQLNLIENIFRPISDDVQMAYETRYSPCIFAQIVPGLTRCILSLIGFPCSRVRVQVILPVLVPETGVS